MAFVLWEIPISNMLWPIYKELMPVPGSTKGIVLSEMIISNKKMAVDCNAKVIFIREILFSNWY